MQSVQRFINESTIKRILRDSGNYKLMFEYPARVSFTTFARFTLIIALYFPSMRRSHSQASDT